MVDEIPGFAGMYIAPTGELVIRVASESQVAEGPLRDAVLARFPSVSAMATRVEQAKHDYATLNTWRRAVAPVLGLRGMASLDLDERRGKIVLGALSPDARDRALKAAMDAGVPTDVVEVVVHDPVQLTAGTQWCFSTLSCRFRPLRGGFQVAFKSGFAGQCTLGFLAKLDEGEGEIPVAIVNSHCTAMEAEFDGGQIYQSTWNTSGHLIGWEGRDPSTFPCVENPVHDCRNSDAALVALTTSEWDFPYIARTSGSGQSSGSTIISKGNPRFKVVSEGPLFMGMTLSKIGITTGWTTGIVKATCEDIAPGPVEGPPTSFTRLCSGVVRAGADGGDSGAPVFRELGEEEGELVVELHGLQWGKLADSLFFFSTLPYIREDLGLFTTHDGQIAPSPS